MKPKRISSRTKNTGNFNKYGFIRFFVEGYPMGLFDFIKRGNKELKQVIVIRSDLNMGRGKMAAQCAHASLSAFLKVQQSHSDIAQQWLEQGQKKVVLKVNTEKELVTYFQECKNAKIPCELIIDAGHTQVPTGSKTCFATGPWNEEQIDKLLGKLKLL